MVLGDVRPLTGTYCFVQLLPSDPEGPMERVLALCVRDDRTGYYECDTEFLPVEILLPRVFVGDSLCNARTFPKSQGH